MSEPDPTQRTPAAALILLAVLAFLVYSPTLFHGFVYDDPGLIASLDGGPPRLHRIVLWTSAWVDAAIWRGRPVGFHLTNVMLHAVTTALVAWVATRIGGRSIGRWAGLTFAVHPVHADVVTPIVHRKEMLALMFGLAATVAWRRSGRSVLAGVLAVTAFVVALLSKEVSIVALPVLLLASMHQRVWSDGMNAARWPVLTMLGLSVAGAAFVLSTIPDPFARASIAELHGWQIDAYGDVVRNVAAGWARAIGLWLGDPAIVAEPPLIRATGLGSGTVTFGAFALIVVTAIVAFTWRRRPIVSFGLLWTAGMLVPTSNLVPLSHFYLPARYLYAASFGVCLLVGYGVGAALSARAVRARRSARAAVGFAAALVCGALAMAAMGRSGDWTSDEAIWRTARERGAASLRAHQGLARLAVADRDYAGAAEELTRAAELVPLDDPSVSGGYDGGVHRDLGWALHLAGRVDEAGTVGESLAVYFPDDVSARLLASRAAMARENDAIARRHLERLDTLRPDEPRTLSTLALLLATSRDESIRDLEAAWSLARRAVARREDAAGLRVMGVVASHRGAFEDAVALAERARTLARAPGDTTLRRILDEDVRRYREGVAGTR